MDPSGRREAPLAPWHLSAWPRSWPRAPRRAFSAFLKPRSTNPDPKRPVNPSGEEPFGPFLSPNEVIMTATGLLPEFSTVAGTDLLLFVLAVAAFGLMWAIGWTAAGFTSD